jgi:alcohol dehydrogenase
MGSNDAVEALLKLQEACGVHDLKMSDFGITREELPRLARIARQTMGFLYSLDPVPLSDAEAEAILQASFK